MPLMTKMREKLSLVFGIFAVVFIVYIVLDWGMDIGGRKSRSYAKGENVGSVNGIEISYQDFQKQIDKYIQMVKQQYKVEPDENQMTQIREEVWNTMVYEILVKQELQKMGMSISDQEIRDWVTKLPETLPEQILKQFTDSTGKNVNHQLLQQVLQSQEPQIKDFWVQAEEMMRQTRMDQKMASLILSTVRISEGELIQKYTDDNSKADGKYVYFDPNVYVENNSVAVQEDEIKNYYNQHKEDYKVEEGRKLRAAIFPLLSSRQDTVDIQNIMSRVSDDLKKGIDFKSLIELHSENKYIDTVYLKHGQIASEELEKKIFDAKIGDVIGPVLDENAFRMIKVFNSRAGKDTYVRTSQILVKFTSANKDSVKNFASELVKRIKKGENILELAKKYSEDPSVKVNSGDMGWKGKNQFVKPYEDAMFAGKVGDVVGPIETVYGFHVIKITGKDSRELNIGDIRLSVLPSSQTKEDIFNKSRDFMNLSKEGDFVREAELSKAEFHETQMFLKGGTVPGIGYHTGVNKFAFNNKVGSVSEVYRIGNAYVVFQVAEERKAGYKDISEVKETIKNTLIFEKKMAKLKDLVNDMRSKLGANDSIDKLTQLDSRLKVVSTGSFVPNTSIPGIGRDAKLVGKIMGLNPNSISQALEGSRGYYIFNLFSKSSFDQVDFNSKRNGLYMQVLQEKQNHFYTEWRRILTEKAEIVDDRDKFYR